MTAVLFPHRRSGHDPVLVEASLGDRDSLAGQVGASGADQELVLAAHDHWGIRAADRLNGAFAYAARGVGDTVVLARDVTGQIPLVYAITAAGVVVATDVAEVAASPGVPQDIDREALAYHYALVDRPILRRTGYRAIAKVPPGHVAMITAGSVQEYRYWRPEQLPFARGLTMDQHLDRIDDVLHRVVAEAVAGHQHVGVHLSGGLDSGLLAAVSTQTTTRVRRAYSYAPTFESVPHIGHNDERDRVLALARRLDLPVSFTEISDEVRRGFAEWDPVAHPHRSWLLESAVVRDAASRGITAMVSGWGGDEVLGARPAPTRLHAIRKELRHRLGATLLGQRADAWAPRWPQVAAGLHAMIRSLNQPGSLRSRQIMWLANGHLAARNESWFAGARSSGLRHVFPLQDRRVLEVALAVPQEFFEDRKWSRVLLRRLASRHLPVALAWSRVVKRQSAQDVIMAELRGAGCLRTSFSPVDDVLDIRDRVMAIGLQPAGGALN